MSYVDGFVVAVPTANKQAYLEFARKSVPVFKKYGALRLVETWGNDCLLYTSPSPRDQRGSRMPSSA